MNHMAGICMIMTWYTVSLIPKKGTRLVHSGISWILLGGGAIVSVYAKCIIIHF